MKRALVLAPLAVLPQGCVTVQADEAGSTWGERYGGDDRRDFQNLNEVANRWLLPETSPWASFSKLTLPSAYGEIDPAWLNFTSMPGDQAVCAAHKVAQLGVPSDTLWIVDLPGAESVRFAASLSRSAAEPVAPVLTFNNWPDQREVIPTRGVLEALATEAPNLPAEGVRAAPVFVLDAHRLAFADQQIDPERYDNRYALVEPDFPSAQLLKEQGIRRVIYLVADRSTRTTEEDDLNPVLLAWQAAGLELSFLAVSDLCELPEQVAVVEPGTMPYWDQWLWGFGYWVAPRPSRCDLGFFTRSPGGFGGARAFEGLATGIVTHGASSVGGGWGGFGGFGHAHGSHFGGHGGFGGGFGGHGGGG